MSGKCEGCKYWDSFTWVCSNADIPYCADYTNDGCGFYEVDMDEELC